MTEPTIYEFPLNERIRVFLRLEHLFAQLDYFLSSTSVWNNRAAIQTLVDILTLSNRGDLKSEILKELDYRNNKHHQNNQQTEQQTQQLKDLLTELTVIGQQLQKTEGKVGSHLLNHHLFQSITQRSAIAGGHCCFDLPGFHFWLKQSENQQHSDLQNWIKPLIPVRTAIALILNFLRNSNANQQYVAKAGFFQMSPNNNQSYQMLKVSLASTSPYFVEFSGGKHRFSLRFMQLSKKTENRPKQTQKDVTFNLNCCLF